MTIELTQEDVQRLIPLVESAIAEVDASAEPDAMVQPDDPMSLMRAYDWGQTFLLKLKLARRG